MIIGLSGGIASGKNFIATIFKRNGAAVFDADKEVHKLLELNKSVTREISKNFPQVIINQKIDRKSLGEMVFADKKKLKILEEILHPKIRKIYQKFLRQAQKKNNLIVLNIPLLLENEAYKCDKIIAVITSKKLQKQRFLTREKEKNPKEFESKKKDLEKKFQQISARQINNLERKKKADFVIKNDGLKSELTEKVMKILMQLTKT